MSANFTTRLYAREWETVDIAETAPDRELPSLFQQTLRMDIDTAGYYELLEWCRSLHLSENGDVQELRKKLHEFYGIEKETEKAKPALRTITIKSANSTEYFTLDEIDEKYILLEGNIVMEMTDKGKKTKHTINAEQIIYNQTEKTVTAQGNITYVLNENGKEETFTGTSMNFNVDTWSGLFFEGTTASERTVDSKQLTYYITGETMYRSGEDTVILTNGSITSSDLKHPYYHIKTKKIWILGPGEWALENAVLYVGTVPLFYIPFFFKTGDEIFFHPTMGIRDTEGFFAQTTTYIKGERKKTEEPFSFLQVYDQNEGDYKKEIRGLYLRKAGLMTDAEKKEKEKFGGEDNFIKIMLDFYSRLGYFAGFEAGVADKSIVTNFNAYLSLARSRNIFITSDETSTAYSALWTMDDGTAQSYWNTSNLFSLSLPFRYGLAYTTTLKNDYFSLNSSVALFSDPFYLRDFNRREEKLNWAKFIGITDAASEDAAYDPGFLGYSELIEEDWLFKFKMQPDVTELEPFVNDVSITNLDLSLFWKKKDLEQTGITGLDPLIPGYIPPSSRTDYTFPEQQFFYPDSYLLPGISFKISGTIFGGEKNKPEEKKEKSENNELPGTGPQAPWQKKNLETVKEEELADDGFPGYRIPDMGGDLTVSYEKPVTSFEQQFSYNVNPTFSFDNRTLSADWNTPGDIDFTRAYSLLSAYGATSLAYKAAVLQKLFLIQDTLSLTGDIRKHFVNTGPTEEEIAQFTEDDSGATQLKLGNSFILTTYPLLQTARFKESSVSYQLDSLFFNHRLDYIDDAGVPLFSTFPAEWTKDYITAHKVASKLAVLLLEKQQAFDFQAMLPPLVPLITLSLTGRTGPFTTVLSQSFEKPEEEDWIVRPFTITEQIALDTIFTFEQFFSYNNELASWTQSKTTAQLAFFKEKLLLKQTLFLGDVNESDEIVYDQPLFTNPYSAVSTLNLWWFIGEFTARRFIPYEFNPDSGWQLTETETFVPEKLTLGLRVQEKADPFWKNRIRLTVDSSASVTMNFNKFTDSLFTLNLGFTFSIADFLDLSFSLTSENKQIYKYFSGLASKVGTEPVSIFTDIAKSLNVFDETARRETSFNAKKLSIKAAHNLKDWNLIFDYQAFPQLITQDDGFKYYEWERQFSILVKWAPVPELKSNLRYKDKTLSY